MTTTIQAEIYVPTTISPESLFQAIGRLRREAQDEIDRLIAFLDSTDPDADAEPSLGWTAPSGHWLETPEDLIANANAGDDREADDEREPHEDDEANLGWRNEGPQTGEWNGNPLVGLDVEGTSPEFA